MIHVGPARAALQAVRLLLLLLCLPACSPRIVHETTPCPPVEPRPRLRVQLVESPGRTGLTGRLVDHRSGGSVIGAQIRASGDAAAEQTFIVGDSLAFRVDAERPGAIVVRVLLIGYYARTDTLQAAADRTLDVVFPLEPQPLDGCGFLIIRRKAWWQFW